MGAGKSSRVAVFPGFSVFCQLGTEIEHTSEPVDVTANVSASWQILQASAQACTAYSKRVKGMHSAAECISPCPMVVGLSNHSLF